MFVAHSAMSERRACRLLGMDRSSYRYRSNRAETTSCVSDCGLWRRGIRASAVDCDRRLHPRMPGNRDRHVAAGTARDCGARAHSRRAVGTAEDPHRQRTISEVKGAQKKKGILRAAARSARAALQRSTTATAGGFHRIRDEALSIVTQGHAGWRAFPVLDTKSSSRWKIRALSTRSPSASTARAKGFFRLASTLRLRSDDSRFRS